MPAERTPVLETSEDDTLPDLMRMIDTLYRERLSVRRLDVVTAAGVYELPDDVVEMLTLLPAGTYSRQALADQLNSIIVGHGRGRSLGTVE